MIQEENLISSEKEKNEKGDYIQSFPIFNKKLFNSTLNKEAFFSPLNDNFSIDKIEKISLEEIKNIMNDSPKIDLDEELSTEVYFIKTPSLELQSTDTTTKTISIPENKEDDFNNKIFTTILHHKRGRKENMNNKKINKKIHSSDDFDNIQRKIQVSFISFLVRLANDALKTIFGKKTKFHFKDVKYELKKIVNHNYIEQLKKRNYSDIMQMKISPKNKKFCEDANKDTLDAVCKKSEILKNFFGKNYLYIFQKYYCTIINNNKNKIDFDGLEIYLSPKTKTLYNLLIKNEANKEKVNNVVKDVYFSGFNYDSMKKFTISSSLEEINKKKNQ